MAEYGEKLMDSVLSNSALTDGLNDKEAELMYAWARAQCEYLGRFIQNDEEFDFVRGNLFKLMDKMSLIARKRASKDAVWVNEKLDELDSISRQLDGAIATNDLRHSLHDIEDRREILDRLAQHYDLDPPNISELPTTKGIDEQKRSIIDTEGEIRIDLDEVFADVDSTAGKVAKDVMEMLRNIAREAGIARDGIEDVADNNDLEDKEDI